MNWDDFFAAIALLLVFEGLLPFMNPPKWRFMMKTALQQNDSTLRFIGLGSMALGLVMLYAIRG